MHIPSHSVVMCFIFRENRGNETVAVCPGYTGTLFEGRSSRPKHSVSTKLKSCDKSERFSTTIITSPVDKVLLLKPRDSADTILPFPTLTTKDTSVASIWNVTRELCRSGYIRRIIKLLLFGCVEEWIVP